MSSLMANDCGVTQELTSAPHRFSPGTDYGPLNNKMQYESMHAPLLPLF